MRQYHDIMVTTQHTKNNKKIHEFSIDTGLITWTGIYFPDGCHRTVRAKMMFQTHQILPRNQESWCRGNGEWYPSDTYIPVTAEPLKCKVISWGKQCNYNHEIVASIELMPWEQVPKWDKLIQYIKQWLNVIGAPIPETPEKEMKPRL